VRFLNNYTLLKIKYNYNVAIFKGPSPSREHKIECFQKWFVDKR